LISQIRNSISELFTGSAYASADISRRGKADATAA
jgi:hypothetical protein